MGFFEMKKEKKENICELKIFENGNEMREHCGKGKWKWRRRSRAPTSLNEAKRCCFCQLLKEDAITGQYFVQMRPFLLFLVLCGRSSSTNAAGS